MLALVAVVILPIGYSCDLGWEEENCSACMADYYPAAPDPAACQTFCEAGATCNSHGSCSALGECVCDTGWTGAGCTTCADGFHPPDECHTYCDAVVCPAPEWCDPMGRCECPEDRWGTRCDLTCPDCYEPGTLECDWGRNATGTCVCAPGFAGWLCDQEMGWAVSDWGPCSGTCGGLPGNQTRTVFCENPATMVIYNDSHCHTEPKPEGYQLCTTSLCGCGSPPSIDHGDVAATSTACPELPSGGTCSVICLAGHDPVGEFRCDAATYVEFAACVPVGLPAETLPALYSECLLLGIDTATVSNITAYAELAIEALVAALSRYTSIPEDTVQARDFLLEYDSTSRRLSRAMPAAQASAKYRRLSSHMNVRIPYMVASSDAASLSSARVLLDAASAEPSHMLSLFLDEQAILCAGFAPALRPALCKPPQSMLVTLTVDSEATFYDAPQSTHTQPASGVDEGGSTELLTTGPGEDDGGGPGLAWVFALGLGLGVGLCVVSVCIIACGCYLYRNLEAQRQAQVAPVKPAKLDAFGFADNADAEWNQVQLSPQAAEMQIAMRRSSTSRTSRLSFSSSPKRLSVWNTLPEFDTVYDRIAFLEDRQAKTCRHGWRMHPGSTVYYGELSRGIPNGEGRQVWNDGRRYHGQWKDGLPHGAGLMQGPHYENSWIYNGQFADGYRHGVGRYEESSNGTRTWYDGDWREDVKHGLGELGTEEAWPMPGQAVSARNATIWKAVNDSLASELATSDVMPPPEEPLVGVVLSFGGQDADEAEVCAECALLNHGLDMEELNPLHEWFGLYYKKKTSIDEMAERWAIVSGSTSPAQVRREEEENWNFSTDDHERPPAWRMFVDLPRWGMTVGYPKKWIAGAWGAVPILRIHPGGPLDKWNAYQRMAHPEDAVTVLPNALIWCSSDIAGDGFRILQDLRDTKRDSLAIDVRNPPAARTQEIRRDEWKRTGWRVEPPKGWMEEGYLPHHHRYDDSTNVLPILQLERDAVAEVPGLVNSNHGTWVLARAPDGSLKARPLEPPEQPPTRPESVVSEAPPKAPPKREAPPQKFPATSYRGRIRAVPKKGAQAPRPGQ